MRLQFLGCGDAFAQRWPVQHVLSPPPQAIFESQLRWIRSKKIRHM
jgi:hypothetical protein